MDTPVPLGRPIKTRCPAFRPPGPSPALPQPNPARRLCAMGDLQNSQPGPRRHQSGTALIKRPSCNNRRTRFQQEHGAIIFNRTALAPCDPRFCTVVYIVCFNVPCPASQQTCAYVPHCNNSAELLTFVTSPKASHARKTCGTSFHPSCTMAIFFQTGDPFLGASLNL